MPPKRHLPREPLAEQAGAAEVVTRPGAPLRRLRTGDLADFQAYRSIPELGRFQGWSPMSAPDAAAFLAEMAETPLCVAGAWIQLGIADVATDRLIGDIGIHLAADRLSGELGFTLAPAFQGRGIASAAARQAVSILFGIADVQQVFGITDSRNLPSVRLLQRVGFRYRESRATVFRGEACVEEVHVLTRNDAGSASHGSA